MINSKSLFQSLFEGVVWMMLLIIDRVSDVD
jgi:hypothetical protein